MRWPLLKTSWIIFESPNITCREKLFQVNMLYQVARWFAVVGVTVALISEAMTYLALLLSAICWLIADWKQHELTVQGLWGQFVQALGQRKWWAWFLLAAIVWIVEGLLAAAIQGNSPRSSHLYKAFFVD